MPWRDVRTLLSMTAVGAALLALARLADRGVQVLVVNRHDQTYMDGGGAGWSDDSFDPTEPLGDCNCAACQAAGAPAPPITLGERVIMGDKPIGEQLKELGLG